MSSLVWFRTDLRLADNPALAAALSEGEPVAAIYVHETDATLRPIGAAARWWLHHSLRSLAADLAGIGVTLETVHGTALEQVRQAMRRHEAGTVHWNRRYAPAECALDADIKASLKHEGLEACSHNSHLLVEPFDIETAAGKPYSVFSPFWKALRRRDIPAPRRRPPGREPVDYSKPDADYEAPKWSAKLAKNWRIGEAAARDALDHFLETNLREYPQGRDVPAKDLTSQLSPHLRHGEIGPRQIWHRTLAVAEAHPELAAPAEKFLSELAWREFSYHLLHHREDIARVAMQEKYSRLRWRDAEASLESWQKGETGIPIVDAGMRQLWETGWMHNRVRMLTASLLAKNLLIDWRRGETWFWDTLVDADIANNPASWQWVAGSGADAAPYFRVFNPVTQGERFDAAGDYVRRWLPELRDMPEAWVHKPSEAPKDLLETAGVRLGETYPRAIVDLKQTRQRALDALSAL